MADWKKVLAHFTVNVEDRFDELKYRLGARLGGQDPVMIRPYRGFGSPSKVYIKGRVLENKDVSLAEENDSLWNNLVNMYKRFESDEVPYARVLARFQGTQQEVVADEEGYFELWIEPKEPLATDPPWHSIELELLAPLHGGDLPVKAEGQVFIPPPGAQYGVISDIDDTVLQTDATHLLRMARNVFLGNARTRLPFPGVAAFYRALFYGGQGDPTLTGGTISGPVNPLFYVSSSPWNLYGLLSEFFNLQDIPIGPILFLRDWGINRDELLPTGHRSHKLKAIEKVLTLYKDLPFILIGDSGQEDPEIYSEVVDHYPHRIKAIYIRNVSRDLKRPEAIRELAKKVAEAGSTLILADDTLPMAQHAAEQGWISPSALPLIEAHKEADTAPPSPVEQLLGETEEPEAPTVVVDAQDAQAAQETEEKGAVEQALDVKDSEGKKPDEKPPTVIVEGDEHNDPE